MQYAVAINDIESVQYLINKHLTPHHNTLIIPQTSCLHLCALYNRMNILEWVLSGPHTVYIDVDQQDQWGFTALHYATSRLHLQVIQRLIAAGATVTVKSKKGTTCHEIAIMLGRKDIAEVLMSHEV